VDGGVLLSSTGIIGYTGWKGVGVGGYFELALISISEIGIAVGEIDLARGNVQAGRNITNINKTVRVLCTGIPLSFILE
jgi:hypothetical protein